MLRRANRQVPTMQAAFRVRADLNNVDLAHSFIFSPFHLYIWLDIPHADDMN